MDRQTNRERADALLYEWYRWSKPWRPALGAPKLAPYCREAQISKQYDQAADLTHDQVYQNEMKAVAFCVYELVTPMQQAIGCEMKNREVKSTVWRCPGASSFAAAMDAILPVMRKRGLFD
jgi:hypothetical protein